MEAPPLVQRLEFLKSRERFIPIRLPALCDRMLADGRLSAEERQQLDVLFRMVAARFHFEFHEVFTELEEAYDPFDPDRDTLPSGEVADRGDARRELAERFERLLLDANYVEMPANQVIACAEYPSQRRLCVRANLSDYAELRVFYRGIRQTTREVPSWLRPWRTATESRHVFSRVALLVRLAKDPDGPVYLKLFKNVVAEDLEMLLPYVRIQMRWRDHLKVGSSVAGGVATAAWKVLTAAILSPVLLALVIGGFAGAAFRGVMSFLSSRTKYLQTLSSSLYFQNLANNSSVIGHLVDVAEAEECKELLLAYFLLYVERDRDFTQPQLDRRVEQWLRTEYGIEADFEIRDAIEKLCDKQLLVRRPGADVLKVFDLPTTLRKLDEVWDGYFEYNGASRAADRVADSHSRIHARHARPAPRA